MRGCKCCVNRVKFLNIHKKKRKKEKRRKRKSRNSHYPIFISSLKRVRWFECSTIGTIPSFYIPPRACLYNNQTATTWIVHACISAYILSPVLLRNKRISRTARNVCKWRPYKELIIDSWPVWTKSIRLVALHNLYLPAVNLVIFIEPGSLNSRCKMKLAIKSQEFDNIYLRKNIIILDFCFDGIRIPCLAAKSSSF